MVEKKLDSFASGSFSWKKNVPEFVDKKIGKLIKSIA